MDFTIPKDLILKFQELIAFYGLKLVFAIAIFVFGRWISKFIKSLIRKIMTRAKVEETLISFTCNLIYTLLIAFVLIAALGQLGIQTTSFIAILGAAGLAVGLALQGSLSNFAAGVLMIIFKPFKVGDFIEGAGIMGAVTEIGIFTTTLNTTDNKKIIVPNSKISGDNIINYSAYETRRIDLVIGVSYQDNLDKVKTVLTDILEKDSRILKEPAPTIAVSELADSSVNFVVRPWVNSNDYWDVYFDKLKTIKERFDEEGISIPFPNREIHIHEADKD